MDEYYKKVVKILCELNGNVINCGLVNLINAYNTYSVTAFYLPSVGNGEFMRITIIRLLGKVFI